MCFSTHHQDGDSPALLAVLIHVLILLDARMTLFQEDFAKHDSDISNQLYTMMDHNIRTMTIETLPFEHAGNLPV